MFNWSQCFPDVAVALVSTGVVAHTGRQASMLGLGGVAAFGGAIFVLLRRVGAGEYGLGEEPQLGALCH
jgi:hypothetical protein